MRLRTNEHRLAECVYLLPMLQVVQFLNASLLLHYTCSIRSDSLPIFHRYAAGVFPSFRELRGGKSCLTHWYLWIIVLGKKIYAHMLTDEVLEEAYAFVSSSLSWFLLKLWVRVVASVAISAL